MRRPLTRFGLQRICEKSGEFSWSFELLKTLENVDQRIPNSPAYERGGVQDSPAVHDPGNSEFDVFFYLLLLLNLFSFICFSIDTNNSLAQLGEHFSINRTQMRIDKI